MADLGVGSNPAQDAIHELAVVRTTEGLGQLDRFVDRGLQRDTGQITDLKGRDAQKGPFHLCHLVETPIARRLREQHIDLGLVIAHPLDQHPGKLRHLGIRPGFGDVILEGSLRVAAVALELEQHFERELAGQVTPSHRYESSGNLTSPTNTLTSRTSRPSILSMASATCRCTSAATVGTWAE